MNFFTMGVYNSTEFEFFQKLTDNKIDTFCDIRLRRGVRGPDYTFANSNRLQKRLETLHINYAHIPELAPTKEIIEMQAIYDKQRGIKRRSRQVLGQEFKEAYKKQILKNFDFNLFIKQLAETGAQRIVLFCVEAQPEACHRSMVKGKLKNLFNFEVVNL